MAGRDFSFDPLTGVKTVFHDTEDGGFILEKKQDISGILEHNLQQQNAQTSVDRWGDGRKVASIPMSIYADWIATGKANDPNFVKRWLNDPENSKFRTFKGKV